MCMQTGIQTAINTQTSAIVASHDALAQTYRQGFDELNNTIDMGFSGISNQLGYMSAAFSFGLDRVSDTLKGMSKDICDRLDKIHYIVNNPLLTQSRELFRRAIANYNKGFFEEALEDIQAAVEKYKTDYISWFLMGKLFAFGVGEFSNVINLDEAIKAFTQAAKYNSPNIAESTDSRLLSAEIYFYLGAAQYSQSNELIRVKKDVEASELLARALKSFEQSFLYSKKMFESLFNSARCKVLQGQKKAALDDLEKLVLFDRNYCIKVYNDNDFSDISNEFTDLINRLKHEHFVQAEQKYKKIIPFITLLNTFEGVSINLDRIPSQFTEELPYFDVMDYNVEFNEVLPEVENVIAKQYNKLLNRKKTTSSYDVFDILAKGFHEIKDYKDSSLLSEECEKMGIKLKEENYQSLLSKKKTASGEDDFLNLYRQFRKLNGYKDSNVLADESKNNHERCTKEEQQQRMNEEQQRIEEQHRIEEENLRKREKENWAKQGLCYYCGGQMGGLFIKKCKSCGKSS